MVADLEITGPNGPSGRRSSRLGEPGPVHSKENGRYQRRCLDRQDAVAPTSRSAETTVYTLEEADLFVERFDDAGTLRMTAAHNGTLLGDDNEVTVDKGEIEDRIAPGRRNQIIAVEME